MDISRKNGRSGTTLIEILIVVALLGILTAVLVKSLSGTSEAGKQGAAKLFAQTTLKALLMAYWTARGAWPKDIDALIAAGFADKTTFESPWAPGKEGYGFELKNGNVLMSATYGGGETIKFDAADGNNGCAFTLEPSGKLTEKPYATSSSK